jgi:hypothetical protein
MIRKALKYILGLLLLAIVCLYGWSELLWLQQARTDNVESFNRNMRLTGRDRGYYYFGKAYQNPDGTVFTASLMTDRNHLREYAIIQKLNKDLNLLWERKRRLDRFNIKDLLPAVLQSSDPKLQYEVVDITVQDKTIYVLAWDKRGNSPSPLILHFDQEGQLLRKVNVNLFLETNAYPSTRFNNGFAYICYLSQEDKMICLTKIDPVSGKIINTALKFWNKLYPEYNSFAINSADSSAAIALYDYKRNLSSYFTVRGDAFTEHFRTAPGTLIKALEYLDGRMYGVVQEDSLLQIIDLTNPKLPLVNMSDIPVYKNYQVCGLTKLQESFYLALNVPVDYEKSSQQGDIYVIRYSVADKPAPYRIGGMRIDLAKQIFATPDSQIAVMGTSCSHRPAVGMRNFVSKFRLQP